ncbi:MAG: hypothetical protein ACR2NG_07840 [Acidimicrobiia bacterium]
MKKWFIAVAAAGVLAIGAFAFVGVTTTRVSAAEEDPSTTEDEAHGQWHDELLDRLVEGGVITQDQADDIDENLPEGINRFRGQGFRSLPEDFDPEAMLERMQERLENFDPEDLPEGFELPEGFDLGEMLNRFTQQLEDFDPENLPEGFALPEDFDPSEMFGELERRFKGFGEGTPRAQGFGFLRDELKDVFGDMSPDEIKEAIENGTLADLIDTDAILESASSSLDEAVADGALTAEQADRILERLVEKLESIENGDFELGRKGRRGHRGFGQFGPFGGQEEQSQAEGTSIEA